MKYLFFVIILLAAGYVGWSWHLSVSRPQWLWSSGFPGLQPDVRTENVCGGFRVHIRPTADTIWQAYINPQEPISMDSCFSFLGKHEWCSIWLVADSLDNKNLRSLQQTLVGSAFAHQVTAQRIVVETDRWELMRQLTLMKVTTAYTWNAPHPSGLSENQKDSVVTRIYRIARSGQVNALTISRAWYPYFHGQLADLDVHFLVCEPMKSAFQMMLDPMSRVMLADSQVKGMLIRSTGSGS